MLEKYKFRCYQFGGISLYEEVNQIGKKLPLFFTNEWPSALKKIILLNLNHTCSSTISNEQDVYVTL